MNVDTVGVLEADYTTYRDSLAAQMTDYRKQGRPLMAGRADAARRRVNRALLAEQLNPPPVYRPSTCRCPDCRRVYA